MGYHQAFFYALLFSTVVSFIHAYKIPLQEEDKYNYDFMRSRSRPNDEYVTNNLCNGVPEVITNPTWIRFPLNGYYYDNDQDCIWSIQAPEDCIIEITLYKLDIEECEDCVCDRLMVYDGDTGSELAKMCGQMLTGLPQTEYSVNNLLDVRFQSDHSLGNSGFEMEINFKHVPAVGFFAVKTSTVVAEDDPVVLKFDEIRVNESSYFNDTNSQFICPISGNYYFNINAGAAAGQPVRLVLRKNGQPFVSVVREAIEHNNVDTLSRAIIMPLEQNDVIDLVVNPHTTAYSDSINNFQTSLTGFLLPYFPEVQDSAAFAGQVINQTTYPESCHSMKFEKRLLGHEGWGEDPITFTFPYDGIYMAGIGIAYDGTFINSYGGEQLTLNGNLVFGLHKGSKAYHGFDTTSREFMLNGNTQDKYVIQACDLKELSSPELQSYMSMFLVSSTKRSCPLFAGYKTESTSESGRIEGYSIQVQEGEGFNAGTGIFICQTPGIYFITFSALTLTTKPAIVHLMLNSGGTTQIAAGLTRYSTTHDGYDQLSRALLIDLDVGDQLYLNLEIGSEIYSHTSYKQTSFSGFLLYKSDLLAADKFEVHPSNATAT